MMFRQGRENDVTRRGSTLVMGTAALLLAVSPVFEQSVSAAQAARFADQCGDLRKPFSQIKNYRLNKTFGGAAKGFLVGVGLALLNEALGPKERYVDGNGQVRTRAKISSVAIIAASTTAGAVTGNVQAGKESAAKREELQRALAEQGDKDNAVFSPLGQKLVDLGECRRQQIAAVTAARAAGEIDAKEGGKRLQKVAKWIATDDKVINAAAKQQTKFVEGYAVAYARTETEHPDQTFDAKELVREAQAEAAVFEPTFGSPATTAAASTATPAVGTVGDLSIHFVKPQGGANLRKAPSSRAALVAALPFGTQVMAGREGDTGWYRVQHLNQEGYMAAELLTTERPARIAQAPQARERQASASSGQRQVAVARTPRQPVTPRDRYLVAVASGSAFQRTVAVQRTQTQAALDAAYKSMMT